MTYLQQELTKLMTNNKQRKAYLCDDNCVVQAGPGSGKTATLVLKIIRLLTENISPPRGLACLTFNNEAVCEFKNRLKQLGFSSRINVFLGTVHSFCLSSVIRPYGRIFYDDLPSPIQVAPDRIITTCLQKAMDQIKINEHVSQFQTKFNRYRRTFLDRNASQWFQDEECAQVIEKYESLIHSQGYVDFDDLILIALKIIETHVFVRKCLSAKYPWFVIDEYQDLGYPLHRIVLSLMDKTDIKVFAVGDPDQSIYGFTGADPKYLQQLADRNDVRPIRLELNYRCGQKIIDGAEVILSPSTPRNYKSNRGNSDPGEIFFVERLGGLKDQVNTIVEEILPQLKKAGYKQKETALLYIDRNDAKIIIEALNNAGIKYAGEKDQRYKRTPFTRWIENLAQWCCSLKGKEGIRFKDISSFWLNLLRDSGKIITDEQCLSNLRFFLSSLSDLQNPQMLLIQWLLELDKKLSFQNILKELTKSPEEILAFNSMISACEDGKPLKDFTVIDLAGCGPNADRISLNTLHSSKGLQFDVVIIPGLEEGRLPSWGVQSAQALMEARRTFYVGFTRARHLVYILYSGWYHDRYGRVYKNGPSQFVVELQTVLNSRN